MEFGVSVPSGQPDPSASLPASGPLPSRRSLRLSGSSGGPATASLGPPTALVGASAPAISSLQPVGMVALAERAATGALALDELSLITLDEFPEPVALAAFPEPVALDAFPEPGAVPGSRAERRRRESRTARTTPSRSAVAPGSAGQSLRRRRSMLALKVGCLAAVVGLGAVIVLQHDGTATVTTVSAAPTGSPTGSQWAGSNGSGLSARTSPLPAAAFLGGAGASPSIASTGAPTAPPSLVPGAGSPVPGGAVPSASAKAGKGVAGAGASGIAAAGGSGAGATVPVSKARTNQAGGTMSVQMYGPTVSGLPWHSGFWLGGTKSTDRINQAGVWRGRPMDFATVYPQYADWNQIADPSSCIGLFAGFKGRLALGLPMLPSNRAGQWDDILSGAHDDVFRTIARNMKAAGFGDSAVRVGLEANGDWFPWGANASNAAQYKAAFRRIVGVMRAQAPQLSFWFDTSASANPLPGGSNRLDVFSMLYPGDDVVDGISMDHYDFYSVVAHNATEFAAAMRPANGAGLGDAVDFARKHGKGFAVPEWGLHAQQGAGDNPYFFTGMYGFFQQNKDVLVFEDYFNEDASYIGASIWDPVQNPQSSAVYKQLWGG